MNVTCAFLAVAATAGSVVAAQEGVQPDLSKFPPHEATTKNVRIVKATSGRTPVAAKDGTSPLRLIDLAGKTEQTIVALFVAMTAGEFRVDPHPAWDRSGRFVAFNGFVDGTRNVFVADLSNLVRR